MKPCPWQRRCERIVRVVQRSELLDRRAMARELMAIYRLASGIDTPAVKRKGRGR